MLQEKYKKQLVPLLQKTLNIKNVMAVPRLHKIVINCGTSEGLTDSKVMDRMAKELGDITGQKSVLKRAKKAIANFKLKQGDPVACTVTLRRHRMYEFLNRLVNVALPRVRDFRGISTGGFDGHGNFSLGIKEQIIFPEISVESVDKIRGFTITIVTTAKTDKEARALLEALGMPFRKETPRGAPSTH